MQNPKESYKLLFSERELKAKTRDRKHDKVYGKIIGK